MAIERKRIGGVPHKRVPCNGCKKLIWVHWSERTASVLCDDCDPGSRTPGAPHFVGRGDPKCSSSDRYDGRC